MKFISTEEICRAIGPTAEESGLEIFGVETKLGREPSLTIFVDRKEGGIDLDTLETFHNAIDGILDEADVSNGASYTLNVSSPGLDRPLRTERDFERAMGEEVEVRLFSPMQGRKNLECVLTGYDGNNVVLKEGETEFKLPLNKIAKINRAIKFE
ncbi:MAG: ribosome maturation factor RimP [Candidatus Borkfalkiaceae bacterium]|nr:ribosome maturation factor RimP [Christensenellaceae bacterium]